MKPEKSYLIIIIVCITTIILTFIIRTMMYQDLSEHVFYKELDNSPSIVADEKITIYYHERRPYYTTDGDNVYGLCADPIALVFEAAGIEYQWQKTPSKRQLDIIKDNTSRACAAGWFKTTEREKFAKYTLPIYRNKHFIAIARADKELISDGESLRNTLSERRLRLLIKDGYSYGDYIDKQINQWNPLKVVTSVDNTSMLKMVLYHHADYFFISEEEAEDLFLISGFFKKDFKFIHFRDMPMGSLRYIICSQNISDYFIDKLNKAIVQKVQIAEDHNP